MPAADTLSSLDLHLVVVGAHLTGMPLNHELLALGGTLARPDATGPHYRLYELGGEGAGKPGLLRVDDGAGFSIDVEIWTLSAAAFGAFVSRIPPPLGIGTIRLADGSREKGFLVEAVATAGARDISRFGGWKTFQLSLRSVA